MPIASTVTSETPRAPATASSTYFDSPTPDSGTHHVRRPRRAAPSATARARRVFPMPASPVSVIRRVVLPSTTSTSRDASESRPKRGDNGTGIEPPVVNAAACRAATSRPASRSNRLRSSAWRPRPSARARTDESRGLLKRSLSRLRMVRTLTPARSANSSWVSRACHRNPRNIAPNVWLLLTAEPESCRPPQPHLRRWRASIVGASIHSRASPILPPSCRCIASTLRASCPRLLGVLDARQSPLRCGQGCRTGRLTCESSWLRSALMIRYDSSARR